jgi:hypothetical protein
LNTEIGSAHGALVNQSRKTVAPVERPAVGAKPNAADTAKAQKTLRRPLRSSPVGSGREKLLCRYCGSDDLAASFKKRRDARCRACFKKRYGSALRDKPAARTQKTKAAK